MSLSIASAAAPYPERPAARDRWILERRGPRNAVDPSRAAAAFVEKERTERGDVVAVATVFLVNRECPWRCLMCDLWKNTSVESVPPGAIPAQIRAALEVLPPSRRIKLYNSGSFFDPRAVPPEDYAEIAALLSRFERVIVESHPALVGDDCRRFRSLLDGDLEVAMGLETAHPEALERLNKRMTLEDFRRAAEILRSEGIGLRAFVLLGAPFLPPGQAVSWTSRSVETVFDAGATAVSVIPTRAGNGALEELAARGLFSEPSLEDLEEAVASGVRLGRGRVFADLWDLERFSRCAACLPARAERLNGINLTQSVPSQLVCEVCSPSPKSKVQSPRS